MTLSNKKLFFFHSQSTVFQSFECYFKLFNKKLFENIL